MEISTTKRMTQNFTWLSLGEIISRGFNFLVVIYIARVLGAAAFGLLNFALAFQTYLVLLVDSGLSILGTREIAKAKERAGIISLNIFAIRFLIAAVVFSISCLILFFLPLSLELRLLFVGTFLFVFYRAFNTDWAFQGLEKMRQIALSKILFSALSFMMIILLIKTGSDLVKIPFVLFFSGIGVSLFFLFLLFKFFTPATWEHLAPSNWWDYFQEAIPLGASVILIQIYYNLDTIMLGFMDKPEVVGYYNAAYTVVYVLLILGGLIGSVIYPVLVKCYQISREKFKKLVEVTSKYTILMGMPVALGGTMLAPAMIGLIYGEKYINAVVPFQILVWSIVTVYANVPFAFSLLACGKGKEYMISVGMGAILNVFLNVLLIPRFSLLGAAVATILTEIMVWSFLYWYFIRSITYVPVISNFLKGGLATLLLFSFLYFSKLNLILSLLGGTFLYFCVCLLIKWITFDEIFQLIGAKYES